MPISIEYQGRVEDDGKFMIWRQGEMLEALRTHFKGKEVTINISEKKKQKSSPQNKYYWGVIIPIVQEGMREIGEPIDKSRVHDMLKGMFLYEEVVNKDSGEILKVPRDFKDLSTIEFSEYKDNIQQWAAEWLHIVIPNPNEQTNLKFDED